MVRDASEGKADQDQVEPMVQRSDTVAYALQAEVRNFDLERQKDFKLAITQFLTEQISFYQKVRLCFERQRHIAFGCISVMIAVLMCVCNILNIFILVAQVYLFHLLPEVSRISLVMRVLLVGFMPYLHDISYHH